MPRPYVSLTPEPIVPISGSSGGGGSPGVIVEDGGVPTANNLHTTLNFTGAGVTATDAGGGVANIAIPGGGGGGGFTDNATAQRTRQNLELRRVEASLDTFSDIPNLVDSGSNTAGTATAVLADKYFIAGGNGNLYGYDLLTGLNCAGPYSILYSFGVPPTNLIGVRGMALSFGGPVAQDYLFATLAGSPLESYDLSFSSSTNLVWSVAPLNSGRTVYAFNSTTQAVVFSVDVSSWLNYPARVITDSNYAYVAAGWQGYGDLYVVIISQTTGLIVGVLNVASGMANDMCLDGAGNVYVTAYQGAADTGTVQQFSIAAAISSGPLTPVTAVVTTAVQRAYYSCTYDPVTSTVFAGTYQSTDGAEHLVQLNPSTLAEISHMDIVPDGSTFNAFIFLLSAFGSIWVSSFSTDLIRVNPSTFPTGTPFTAPVSAGGCITASISIAGAGALFGLGADTVNNTIFVGDQFQPKIYRVSTASNTLVSTISSVGFSSTTAVYTPTAIWTALHQFLDRYTTPVGSETLIDEIEVTSAQLLTVSGQSPSVGASQVYVTSLSSPVRACFVASGGSPAALYNGSTLVFAVSDAGGHIYLIDPSGGVHDAYSTGDTPGPMFIDDAGYLWVACTTGNTILKLSVNLSTYTLSLVTTISTGVTALDMISDGRYARVIANISNVPTLYAWDLQSGSAGPVFPLAGASFGGNVFNYPRDLHYDTTRGWIWVADQNSKTTTLTAFNASTQAVEHALSVPSLPLSGQLPNSWQGARRVIGDDTYVYACDAAHNSPFVVIINQTTGLVVGEISVVTGRAEDLAIDSTTYSGGSHIYVADNSSRFIKKYSIASAIAAYPGTYTTAAATTSVIDNYHVIAWDPVTSTLFAGTQNFGPTETLYQFNSSLAVVASNAFTYNTGIFQYMIAAFGSIWFSTQTTNPFTGFAGNLGRVNPSTFPAGGSILSITTTTTSTDAISADTLDNTILVGDNYGGNNVSRVSTSTNLQVSSIQPSVHGNNMALVTPTSIWITVADSPTGLFLFTTPIGSETAITEITQVTLPGSTARLAWDGVSIYMTVDPSISGSGG